MSKEAESKENEARKLERFLKPLLETPWQQFYNSRFKHRPARTFFNGKAYWKTNSASWAKQD